MKRPPIFWISLVTFAAGLWLGHTAETGRSEPKAKVRLYQDSMHPWVKSDQPGICSICGMKLTPVCETQTRLSNSNGLITLSREAVTVANVATEPVLRREIRRAIRVSGVFEAQESRTAIVAAPAGGRIDFVAVDHPGMEIRKGETLVRLFSPDLAQRSRFLRVALTNQPATSDNPNKAAPLPGRASKATPGISNEDRAPAVGGYRLDAFMSDLTAPISGIVTERPTTVGQYVTDGQKIATILDPSVLWFRFDAFDRQLSWIAPGQQIQIHTEFAPGMSWVGTVAFVEPVYDGVLRSAKVRAAVTNTPANSDLGTRLALRPGMLGEGRITVILPDVLAVPKSAVVYPGSSAWVYVEQKARTYERRRIRLGQEGDGWWEVRSGLAEGERVVTTGNVLIDAQATFENGGDEPVPPNANGVIPKLEDWGEEVNPSFSTFKTSTVVD